ncbi:MAG: DUF2612 domain-containing protein [Mariprofundaceae bacterium]|nr:DUF2612 domain-containing protein [Methylophaga sp.]MBL4759607.1 DUF2612 domain-containing protein [Mariprofundaceae bacterium]
MSIFTDAYVDLLIKQYWALTKANAEIAMKAGTWEVAYDGLKAIGEAFDVDTATGHRLDILGKIVGMPRRIPLVIAKVAFGFSDNPNSAGFADKFDALDLSAPFQDKFEPAHTDLELDDSGYRFFIKAKVAYNNGSAYMVSDRKISIQDVIATIFSGDAYVVDKFNMALDLYVNPSFNSDWLKAIRQLGILPSPQAVRYDQIIHAIPGETFGFSDNPIARGFADKFDPLDIGGIFANKVI